MKHYTKRVEEHLVLDNVDCDRCGQSMRDSHGMNIEGMVTTVGGGYASPIIGDMVTWHFDVCEKCLEEWGQSFKVKPWDAGDLDVSQRAKAMTGGSDDLIVDLTPYTRDPILMEATGDLVESLKKATTRELSVQEAYARAVEVSKGTEKTLPSWEELDARTRKLWRKVFSLASLSSFHTMDGPAYRTFVEAAMEMKGLKGTQEPETVVGIAPKEGPQGLTEATAEILGATDTVTEVKVVPAPAAPTAPAPVTGFVVHTPGLANKVKKKTHH